MNLPPKAARKQAELVEPLIRQMEEALSRGHPVDQTLRRYYRQHTEFGSRDRRFFSALIYSWFRWRGWLTPIGPARGAMAYLLDAHESHPAVAILAERNGCDNLGLQPAGALSLSEKMKLASRWLETPLSIEQLAPAWLPAQLQIPSDTEPAGHIRRCIEAFQNRPATWIRAFGSLREKVTAALARYEIRATLHPQVAGAIQLQGAPDLERLSAEAPFEVQDFASQCVGLICAPAHGERWWDVCAGSGGKSLHLADLMENQGSILATDVRAGILDNLRKRAFGRWRRKEINCRVWDGTRDPAPGRYFDGVLVDAPCSGIGTWARNPDARWRTAEQDVAGRRSVQRQLLRSGAEKVRPGGRLVYSVCTLTAEETQRTIGEFLDARPDFRLEPMTPQEGLGLSGQTTPGIVWVWPWEASCNGMFIARMKRAAS